jgi:putative ABC transport system permease protein
VSLFSGWKERLARPHLWLIAIIGVIVPRRLRTDWREEWQAELVCRERLLADWHRLDWQHKWDLLRRSTSAFWDALSLQRQRREDEMVQDLRFGLRILLKNPAFAIVAILTLALAIGANTALFSVVNALLLRPLGGVTAPDRLVQLGRQYPDKSYLSDSSYPDYLDWRAQSTVMSGMAAIMPTAFHLSTGQEAERIEGEMVTTSYFDVLGVRTTQGRLISALDEQEAGTMIAVISFRLWQCRFGGNPGVVGTTIKLDGHDFTVIGVVIKQFEGIKIGSPRDVWIPLLTLRQIDPKRAALFERRGPSWLEVFGRLKDGITLEQARAEFSVLARRLQQAYPQTNTKVAIGVESGLGRERDVRTQLQRFAYVPFVAVAILLLIACANVAGLLVARSVARQKEIATRLALGAARIRIVRQLLIESLILAVAGGAAGLAVGVWLTRWLRSLLPDSYLFLSFNLDFGIDWRVFGFMVAVTALTGVLFGLIPGIQASRTNLIPTLKGARDPAHGITSVGLRGILVVTQVALSLILLIAAGLSVTTFLNAAAIDTGYQVQNVLTARIDLAKQNYSQPRGRVFQQQLVDRIEGMPGVEAVGFATTLPLNDGRWEDAIYREDDRMRVQTFQNMVSPGYLDALRIPLIAGRSFSKLDDERTTSVAIVNQTLAQRMWPNADAVGKRFTFKGKMVDVIGVARDIKGRNLFEIPGPMLYLPLLQNYHPATVLHVRTSVPPTQLVAAVRREIHELDENLPIYSIKALDEHLTATLTPQRLLAHLITSFGLLALLLAGIGLYGLMAYTVTERTTEIGVRMALGARKGEVLHLFIARGMKLALTGVSLGLVAAFGVTRLMKGVLFGVSPVDPLTFTVFPLVLILTALIACYLPAREAAAGDPKRALRYE